MNAPPEVVASMYENPPSPRGGSFFTQDEDGWERQGSSIYGKRNHGYDSSVVSTETIRHPGEYFSCKASKWLVLGVSVDKLATFWDALTAGFYNYSSKDGKTIHHHQANPVIDYEYSDLSKPSPSELKFRISPDGYGIEVLVDSIPIREFNYVPSAPLYFYATGAGENLRIEDLKVGKYS
ncbi:MAG: hypothetical protein F6K54_27985 [Okeania sp. SIO3B5]|uniref:hypothetical protein n=1 Tax=Okeania sp. SIO3B5 TaxID=2607811 RepID=UPI00140077EC|nr:hypothetical protein [Okeania sp. SIO3B5]NEO56578.1 hypothetical protein [Okeania sp. SIO3B5]